MKNTIRIISAFPLEEKFSSIPEFENNATLKKHLQLLDLGSNEEADWEYEYTSAYSLHFATVQALFAFLDTEVW